MLNRHVAAALFVHHRPGVANRISLSTTERRWPRLLPHLQGEVQRHPAQPQRIGIYHPPFQAYSSDIPDDDDVVNVRIMRQMTSKRQRRHDYRHARQHDDVVLPRKRFYRQRAHANPFSDHNLS